MSENLLEENFTLGAWADPPSNGSGDISMIRPIQLSKTEEQNFNESFTLGSWLGDDGSDIFTEAVFNDGKKSIKPIVDQFGAIKSELEELTTKAGKNPAKKFNTREANEQYWRSVNFKNLEDTIQSVFGLRAVYIDFEPDAFNYKTKNFFNNYINCCTYPEHRFPIDGLVTNKGFYDSTHSINMYLKFTLPLIVKMTPEEITAVFLHEMGHNIDPALVDINYPKTNALSKYLTDREDKIKNAEKRALGKGGKHSLSEIIILLLMTGAMTLLQLLPFIISKIMLLFTNEEKLIAKIKKAVDNDKDKFNRVKNSEAFADNFARMYGFGAALASAFKTMGIETDKILRTRFKKEKERQRHIAWMITHQVKDVHKTDIHRIKALIKEYEEDLKDPNLPAKVKKDIEADKAELEKVLDAFLNNSDKFQAKVNKLLADAIDAEYAKETDAERKDKAAK